MMRLILKKDTIQFASMGVLSAWILWNVEREYREKARLSHRTSASAWVLYLLHLGLTVSASLSSSKRLPISWKLGAVLGATSAVSGSAFCVAGIREFRSFEQMSGSETGQLVKTGPYRYSRNPQIVGWLLALLGIALAGRSTKALALVGLFFFIHRLYFPIEERHLERTFGEEYRRYQARAPRFLGIPKAWMGSVFLGNQLKAAFECWFQFLETGDGHHRPLPVKTYRDCWF